MPLTPEQKEMAKKRAALNRRRRARGLSVVKIVIPENPITEALMDAGLLQADAETKEALAAAVEKFLRHIAFNVTRDDLREFSRGMFGK